MKTGFITLLGIGSRRFGRTRRALAVLSALFLLGLIPEPSAEVLSLPHSKPFIWNKDEQWFALEKAFISMRTVDVASLVGEVDERMNACENMLDRIESGPLASDAPVFDSLEDLLFTLCPMTAVCTSKLNEYTHLVMRVSEVVKRQSEHWDVDALATRSRMYRLMFGGRAALEEAMLQASPDSVVTIARGVDEPSATPQTQVRGVTIHSGDMLLTRGSMAILALIARGNDYPGVYSHVGLVYVEPKTRAASVIEALPYPGVVVTPIADFLKRANQRMLVLRPRADLPEILRDPMLPHKAADSIRRYVLNHHIPYDFAIDHLDHSRMFCSEVVSAAYEAFGIHLWMGLSKVSSPGLADWIAKLGIGRLEMQEPADLEYDPQLRIVAEWRDPAMLSKDHIDNAATEVILDGADRREELGYAWYLLPVARAVKAASMVANLFGSNGFIPDGMTPAQSLYTLTLLRMHHAISERLSTLAGEFRKREHYSPPDPELVRMAKQIRSEEVSDPGSSIEHLSRLY
ncbi:MAG: YiiX/YebB-like N1pC/P60 family cysteine hydrolase [Bacteroidota bacterium]|nr:YiiX/YebB-like N1pC/P60 family cysteine hydrolase [Bacteroidota bacterium]MDP4230399.1 YiiX/YebB-like N1pC/P60 family cysteine hydrolase [Bacteroidota bacterium]MDP4237225.1 YiiX/YebB-like N1pC/P60 family cysteine hydrolase [Bacteroidota bacterium]